MLRRVIEIGLAGLGLIVAAPLLAGIAALVFVIDGPPVIYRAQRVGQHGRIFHLYKFRTMRPSVGSSVTVWADPRVTALGRRLRRLKLDELPQLANVLTGDMSFVGPRPEDPSYVALYTDEQRQVLCVKPGITGVAALVYVDEESLLKGDDWEREYRYRIMPAKIALEIDYLSRRSPWSDLGLLVRTFLTLFKHLKRTR